jgi:DNA-directed RNA polymerase sigma subunit (sigma70/sigma32)
MRLSPSSTGVGLTACRANENELENSADETLCLRWRDRHDISAAHQLANRHRLLVLQLAETYRACGLPWNDLTGEGHLGLMRAICRFDPDQGVGFATYATWWVSVSLQLYVQKNSRRALGRARVGDDHRRSDDVGGITSLGPAISVPYRVAHG